MTVGLVYSPLDDAVSASVLRPRLFAEPQQLSGLL